MTFHYRCHSLLMCFRNRISNQFTTKTNMSASYPRESSRIIIDESRYQHQNNHTTLYLTYHACSTSDARGLLLSIMMSTATKQITLSNASTATTWVKQYQYLRLTRIIIIYHSPFLSYTLRTHGAQLKTMSNRIGM